jgi:phosphoribosyl 1,2-cyclic phosphodiesterase
MPLRVTYWGARGSIPAPAPAMAGYGGNTSCVEVTLSDGSELILDAGTGIRELGLARGGQDKPVDVLLTHLHLDHIQGLMFFAPLFDTRCRVKVFGPATLGGPLLNRLARYISAPLAPVEIRELPADVSFEEVDARSFALGPARVEAAFVNHRGPTLGYRITDGDVTIAYIPDHEPALGQRLADSADEWISGLELARDADLLIHDAQYTAAEYGDRVGWGHSAVGDALTFARRSGARRLALFHHDPQRDEAAVDALVEEARAEAGDAVDELYAAREGDNIEL